VLKTPLVIAPFAPKSILTDVVPGDGQTILLLKLTLLTPMAVNETVYITLALLVNAASFLPLTMPFRGININSTREALWQDAVISKFLIRKSGLPFKKSFLLISPKLITAGAVNVQVGIIRLAPTVMLNVLVLAETL